MYIWFGGKQEVTVMRETTWVEQYYLEVDKEQRKEILDEGIEEEGMTPENDCLLYTSRCV